MNIKEKNKNKWEYYELSTSTPDGKYDLEFEIGVKIYVSYDEIYDDYDIDYEFDDDSMYILNMKYLEEYNEKDLIDYITDILDGKHKKELSLLEEQIYDEWCKRYDYELYGI